MNSTNTTPQEIPAILKNGSLKKQPRWKTVLSDTFGEYGYLLFAALIPAVLFYLIYLCRGLYPFGDGTVLSAREMGTDVLYEIAFDDVGTKKLMATFAKLKRAES
jgi:hypothetical protein